MSNDVRERWGWIGGAVAFGAIILFNIADIYTDSQAGAPWPRLIIEGVILLTAIGGFALAVSHVRSLRAALVEARGDADRWSNRTARWCRASAGRSVSNFRSGAFRKLSQRLAFSCSRGFRFRRLLTCAIPASAPPGSRRALFIEKVAWQGVTSWLLIFWKICCLQGLRRAESRLSYFGQIGTAGRPAKRARVHFINSAMAGESSAMIVS